MTVGQYKAFKRFHKRSVKLAQWWGEQDKVTPLLAVVGAALFVTWIWS